MSTLTVSYLFDVERRMQIVSNEEYQRLLSNLWYRRCSKEVPMTGKSQRFQWLMDTAGIQYVDRLGGGIEYEELMMNSWEFTAKAASAGFELNKFQFEDVDGGGVDLASNWARQQGSYAAYWPQKQIAAAINAGSAAASLAYDGQIFFSSAHPVNPFNVPLGTYSNEFTGAASGLYPGACPIDITNAATVDLAFNNFQRAITYINGGLTMPNGVDPRFLKASAIFAPPALSMRLQQLTNSKIIAQAAATGGGSADVESVIRNWGIGDPIICPELGSVFGGSDTSYYIAAETISTDPLGAIIYGNREPFNVVYNTGMTDAELNRANKLQWSIRGRNTTSYGHPFLLFKVKAT
jgi:phage major head subunit gpT-like protein